MKQLVVAGYGVRLRYRRGLLLVESKNEKNQVPIADIEQLVIATGGVWFSSKLIRVLIDNGIDVVILDSRGLPSGRIYPPYVNKTVNTRRAQYQAYGSTRGTVVMREIVYAKIANQAGLLKRYYQSTRITELKDASSQLAWLAVKARAVEANFEEAREELRKIEAEAARIYWPSFALLTPRDTGFESRDQDSPDPVNTSLNYAYGVLYNEVWRALVLAGLDPYAGFMHVDRSGKPVLAFDFVEMFRFSADLAILELLRKERFRPKASNGLLDYESRRKIIEALNTVLDKESTAYVDETPVSLRQGLKKATLLLASYLRGESGFQGFVHRW